MLIPLFWVLAAAPVLQCPAGFVSVGPEACLAAPENRSLDKLVVYFHGMLPGTAEWPTTPEFVLLGEEAVRRGYALLALRGEQGLCLWSKEVRNHFCWPSDRSQLPDVNRTLGRLDALLKKLGVKRPPLLAGFSNGGFFLSIVASDTQRPVRAYVLMHAGGVNGQEFTARRAAPTLLVGAREDTIQLPTMKRLEQVLKATGWSPRFSLRDGTHEVTQADATATFDFFDSLDLQQLPDLVDGGAPVKGLRLRD